MAEILTQAVGLWTPRSEELSNNSLDRLRMQKMIPFVF